MTEPMLQVRNIQSSYRRVPAIRDISLSLNRGEIVAIVGGNGNGKSTTLRAIAGLNALDGGAIRLKGQDISAVPAHERVKRGLVLVPEGRRLFPRLTVEQNLMLGGFTTSDHHKRQETLQFAYDTFTVLGERRRQQAGTLSGGEQQMLAMCRGLMSQPDLLMLDEPSWGVAPKLVTRIFETVQQIRERGITVLLVEQNIHRALEIADRGYVIQTGRVVMEGSGTDLLGNDEVRQAYLGM
ncbi:ABC transporter ATP-binding protein [Azospirillum rugosum]|uniref:Branched-chain amino acid transport system ATP-binding protein n=2 Tax=Azospirillum rugosum TaxID=416170 RepID=A0ABS4SMC5_9PROT|nr:ABC transporter ATP-binding protein [Azospirillum rugosum]MBP2293715.1 branched-chain amino acid transport system ATP-binding protein [Azospirillum rugosum]MDQ0527260.1 branched-chain amino acid transport system ATP-binding protein [Azospirillum rugosum]